MARKTSVRRNSSSLSNRKSGKRSAGASYAPIYNDILGIAGTLLRGRQKVGAEKIGSFADAARNLAHDLPDIPNVQTYVKAAADQMENLAEYVAGHSLEQIVEDGTAVAKRYPIATAAFAIAAGFGFTRLMMGHSGTTTKGTRTTRRASSSSSQRKRSASSSRPKANGKDTSHATARAS
jgi:hypothetical protein